MFMGLIVVFNCLLLVIHIINVDKYIFDFYHFGEETCIKLVIKKGKKMRNR